MKIIATKSPSTYGTPGVGYVKPLYWMEDNGEYQLATPEVFKNNGKVFVFGGYGQIDREYSELELFELDNVEHVPGKYEPTKSNSCYFGTNTIGLKRPEPYEFIKIFKGKFDSITPRLDGLTDINEDEPFFILDDNRLYGPLNFDFTTNHLITADLDYFDDGDIDAYFENYKNFCLEFLIETLEPNIYIGDHVVSLKELIKQEVNDIIFLGNKQSTLDWAKTRFKAQLSDADSALLDGLKKYNFPNLTLKTEIKIFERFQQLLDESDIWVNTELPKFLNSFLTSEKGNSIRDKFLRDNEISFFNTYRKEEIENIDSLIENRRIELEEVTQELNSYQSEFIENKLGIPDDIEEEHRQIIEKLISDPTSRENIASLINAGETLTNLQAEIQRNEGKKIYIDSEIDRLKKQIEDLTTRKVQMQNSIIEVKKDFFDNEVFAQRLIETKLYADILNNIDPSDSDSAIINSQRPPVNVAKANNLNGEEFIKEIVDRLSQINRNIEYNDVANYLISIHQNFFTIFSGLPGVGKTSLIGKLSHALGCTSNHRYLSIPVQRGWTSSKDLIGYFNPLTRKYQSSKTGLYDFLLASENDFKNELDFPNWILLDEANLSPIEHYWAEFSSKADEDYIKELSIEGRKIRLSNGLRFIGTINTDHTTELLSERLVNRVPIIQLPDSDYVGNDNKQTDLSDFPVYPYAKISEWFEEKDLFKGDLKNKFDSIVQLLKSPAYGRPVIVSHRKHRAVEKYCNVAVALIKENKFTALDYAVSQHILPLISGRGDNYKKRLNALMDKLSNLPKSISLLENIISVGDEVNYKNYKYFG